MSHRMPCTFLCFLFFINLLINLFLAALCLRCCAHGLSLVAVSRGYSSLWCTDFSLQWPLLLWSTGSRCAGFNNCGMRASVVVARGLSSCGSQAPEHRLSSCGTRAQLLRGMRDLPGPGLEPMSLALAGGFLATAPPRKSHVPF